MPAWTHKIIWKNLAKTKRNSSVQVCFEFYLGISKLFQACGFVLFQSLVLSRSMTGLIQICTKNQKTRKHKPLICKYQFIFLDINITFLIIYLFESIFCIYIYIYRFILHVFIFLIVCVTGVLPGTPLKKNSLQTGWLYTVQRCKKKKKNMVFQTCCLEKNS